MWPDFCFIFLVHPTHERDAILVLAKRSVDINRGVEMVRSTDMSGRVGYILSKVTALTYGQFHNASPARSEARHLSI